MNEQLSLATQFMAFLKLYMASGKLYMVWRKLHIWQGLNPLYGREETPYMACS